MQQRALGHAGPPVSLLGLGCNNFGRRIGPEPSRAVIERALDLGVTLFDTADIYGTPAGSSEQILGEVLGPRRKDVLIATKFGFNFPAMPDSSPVYVIQAVEASLRRLGTDYIDLYQLHLPDPRTPIEETLRVLDELVRQGKVRFIGCSNLPAATVAQAQRAARELGLTPFISAQDEYSLLAREAERALLPVLRKEGMGLLPYFPLAGGMLSGKYRRGEPVGGESRFAAWSNMGERFLTPDNFDRVERLQAFAESRGRTLLGLAFAWLAACPLVGSVIAGATSPEQVEANAAALGGTLTPEERAEVGRIHGQVGSDA